MDYREAAEFLDSDEAFLLSTHINADGDGIGALLALSGALARLGRRFRIVLGDASPDLKFSFLEGFDQLVPFESLTDTAPVRSAIFVDTPTFTEHRVGRVATLVDDQTRVLIIDHHAVEAEDGVARLVDPDASAASELVYGLIQHLNIPITPAMATQIYAGIAFDTKLFKFSNPERGLKACAELVDLGADPQAIANSVFASERFETLKTLGFALASMERHLDGSVSTLSIDHKTYSLGGDLDLIVDHAMAIRGIDVALFFKEEAPGRFRVSLRSRNNVDVNAIAQKFGGGGHQRASGCTLEMPLDEARKALLDEVAQAIQQPGA
jgi:phosphoesterase RecJ-like protein